MHNFYGGNHFSLNQTRRETSHRMNLKKVHWIFYPKKKPVDRQRKKKIKISAPEKSIHHQKVFDQTLDETKLKRTKKQNKKDKYRM